MSEHELTEEKIEELWNYQHPAPTYFQWATEGDDHAARMMSFARAAYDLGKDAQNDDGFADCEYGDVQEGDTVERTVKHSNGTVVTTVGVADHLDSYGNWRDSEDRLLVNDHTDYIYRRKPAPVVHPNPEKHPIILDGDGAAWFWNYGSYYQQGSGFRIPESFKNDWTPAKVVAKEED